MPGRHSRREIANVTLQKIEVVREESKKVTDKLRPDTRVLCRERQRKRPNSQLHLQFLVILRSNS